MEKEISKLRKEGKTYREITKILNCSIGLVSYYCGLNQKEKWLNRQRNTRNKEPLVKKANHFKYGRKRNLYFKYKDFQRGNEKSRKIENSFTTQDVKNKIGDNPICYLTGRKINLAEPKAYNLDHFIPVAKGGTNSIENLRISCKEANMAKSDLFLEEFLLLCKEVLEFNGFKVTK